MDIVLLRRLLTVVVRSEPNHIAIRRSSHRQQCCLQTNTILLQQQTRYIQHKLPSYSSNNDTSKQHHYCYMNHHHNNVALNTINSYSNVLLSLSALNRRPSTLWCRGITTSTHSILNNRRRLINPLKIHYLFQQQQPQIQFSTINAKPKVVASNLRGGKDTVGKTKLTIKPNKSTAVIIADALPSDRRIRQKQKEIISNNKKSITTGISNTTNTNNKIKSTKDESPKKNPSRQQHQQPQHQLKNRVNSNTTTTTITATTTNLQNNNNSNNNMKDNDTQRHRRHHFNRVQFAKLLNTAHPVRRRKNSNNNNSNSNNNQIVNTTVAQHYDPLPSSSSTQLISNEIVNGNSSTNIDMNHDQTTTSIENNNNNSNNNNKPNVMKSEDILKLYRARRNASQFIPMWLRREESWKESVFQHLNLPVTNKKTPEIVGTNNNDSSTYHRRNFGASLQGNFYEDTIPSFSEVLRNGPPPVLYDALDILVAQGLGDPNVAERYRTTVRLRLQSMDWVKAFNDKKQQLKYHRNVIQLLSNDLLDLQNRLQRLENNNTDSSTTTTTTTESMDMNDSPTVTTDNDNIINSIQDSDVINPDDISTLATSGVIEEQLLSNSNQSTHTLSTNQQENTTDIYVSESQRKELIQHVKKIISEKTTNMQLHQHNFETIMKALNQLRKVQNEPPMDDDEYQAIAEAANMARASITKVFADHARDLHSKMLERYQILDSKTDLTKPHDWYLHARVMKRKIIYHGGPTNSGKTYQALQRLKGVEKGMYLGPLRLLAAEIWERLTAEGIYCNLFTGQEVRMVPFATHRAATVEMAPMQEEFDVVVIDEIQMINDKERGFAWTRALLGTRCREIHVCGGLEATEVVKRLVEACGDEFELRTYGRFSELKIEANSLASMPDELGAYKNVLPGDCVVAFSRNDIFAIKREIETNTKYKCSVIYGTLPPATRSEQARRFNDPNSEYEILVASDAIGMGLNLNIRRVIFNSIFKNDGATLVRLDHSSMKQISGRAGRRNSPFPNGFVTTRDPRDMEFLRQCLTTDIEPIEKAGLLPTSTHIQTFSDTLEQLGMRHGSKNLHTILQQFNDIASVKSDYFVCRQDPMVNIAKAIAPFDMAIPDKYIVCQSPVTNQKDGTSMEIVKRFAAKKAVGQSSGLTKNMIPKPATTFQDLARLCLIFIELDLFLWLQRRFPPGNMIEQQTANGLRERAIQYISEALNNAEELFLNHCYVKRDRGIRASWTQSQTEVQFVDDEDEFKHWNDNSATENQHDSENEE